MRQAHLEQEGRVDRRASLRVLAEHMIDDRWRSSAAARGDTAPAARPCFYFRVEMYASIVVPTTAVTFTFEQYTA